MAPSVCASCQGRIREEWVGTHRSMLAYLIRDSETNFFRNEDKMTYFPPTSYPFMRWSFGAFLLGVGTSRRGG